MNQGALFDTRAYETRAIAHTDDSGWVDDPAHVTPRKRTMPESKPTPSENLDSDTADAHTMNGMSMAGSSQVATKCDNLGGVAIPAMVAGLPVPESKPTPDGNLDSDTAPYVEDYSPKGSARSHQPYYRLRYRQGRRWRSRHICGGNVASVAAQRRKSAIELAIAAGETTEHIIKLCK